jgi:hypothetical protein
MSDFLVERPGSRYFDLVPRSDDGYGINAAVHSQRLPEMIQETGLEDSLLATYISQLAIGTVDADLLYVEGPTLITDLRTLSERTKRVESDGSDGFYERAAISEDELIWSALRGYSDLQMLDRNGYKDFDLFRHSLSGLNPFKVRPPETAGASFIRPTSIANPLDGLVEAVNAVEGLRDNPNVTHFMERHHVVRGEQDKAAQVSTEDHLILGRVTKLGEFVSYAGLIGPFQYMK